jgi:heme oxygenase
LKTSTQDVHDAVEGSARLRPILAGRFTCDDYVAFLDAFAGAFSRLDPLLAGAGSAAPPYRRRLGPLRADLQALGATRPPVAGGGAGPSAVDAAYCGRRYVVEGMTLGARVVRARALSGGDPVIAPATRFLSLPGTHWPRLCRWLDETLVDGPALDRAVTEARDTFRLVHALLNEPGGVAG